MKEIGGYFGLELDCQYDNIGGAVALNCARNCLRYVVRAFGISDIYVPFYTCPVVWQSLQKEGCKLHFYHIDEKFLPVGEIPLDAYVLYTNYFGVCAKNVRVLSEKYKNLIVDNAQAFYMPKYGIASFNSIRKFFGVSDGALLYSDKKFEEHFDVDTSYQRFSHLIKRMDVDAGFGYGDFQLNDDALCDSSVSYMSHLTTVIFNSIDVLRAKQKRLDNFSFLHSKFSDSNELVLDLDVDDVPMVYPYLIRKDGLRKKLIDNKIFVAKYWGGVPESCQEGVFQKYILPLPLDQRYDEEDMKRMVEVICD